MKTISLISFPDPTNPGLSDVSVTAGAEVRGNQLFLEYGVTFLGQNQSYSQFRNLPPIVRARKSELWNDTCFEAFLPVGNSSSYFEFNGSLAGNWDLYAFDGYRSGMKKVVVGKAFEPGMISRGFSGSTFVISWCLPLSFIPDPALLGKIGLTVVLKSGEKASFWALKHDGVRPDFHLGTSFIYDTIRN